MKYQVITKETLRELEEAVSLAIEQGWKPQGGVNITSIIYHDEFENEQHQHIFAQALVKDFIP